MIWCNSAQDGGFGKVVCSKYPRQQTMDHPSWMAPCALEFVIGWTGIIHGLSVSSDHRGKGMCPSTGQKMPMWNVTPDLLSPEGIENLIVSLVDDKKVKGERGEPESMAAVPMPVPWHGVLHTHRAAWSSGISDPMAWALCSVFCHLPSHCLLGSWDICTRGPLTHPVIPSLSKVWTPVLILNL